ncbi:hypothetical protein TSUD_402740 [Trifolium subterraneum]|uniref:Reverse transcriptase domain-containing protein n=1 Tax=Trifolium subterraneum TaxID=3900 RepID=A0A2Z6PKF8_TRISU|nr:hypothetical protein TSUD_402740 [Trifolium subterraneum]
MGGCLLQEVHNPPPGLLGQNTTTTAVHCRLVDSDQGKDQWRRLWGLKVSPVFSRTRPKLTTKNSFLDQMAGANHEFVGENHPNPPNHQFDGMEASVTPEGSAAHAQATPLDVPPPHQPPQPEDPQVVPQVPQGAPMEVGQILREQANNMRGHNELIREQNRRLRAVEESRAASRILRSARRQRSSTPENNRSRSRSRSPRPAPRRHAERPASPPRDIPRRQNHSPPRRNNHVSPPRNRRSPPRRNNRSPPRSGEASARGGNARHSPRRESPGSGDERHREPLSRRIMDIPLPRGLEKPPTLDKYDGTTDPDEHVQSVETALDYRNLRGSIKCKLFPLSLVRGASTWWRNLPPGSIDSWEELCRTFTAHFTTSRRHPKTVASLKAIVQGPEESLRNYIERLNKVSVEVEATDKMKLYLLEKGLREGTKFQEAVGILEVQTLDALFELAQRYIKYEDKQKASEVRRLKTFEVGGPSSQREERRGDEKKREGGKVREAKPPKTASKNLNSVVTPKKKKAEAKLPGVNSISTENEVELDARTSKKERKQEKKTGKDDLSIKENYRPIPDGEFELVPLGEDPTKGVKVGADLPDLVKRQLKACLKENVELFAWSAAEMPEIDPEVACHQLTIDPRASAVVQRRRKQSPEKAEAARKAVKDLLEANFIVEAQYTTWLSNVVLVKKSNGKWRMCVDYTDLNRVCPKDAYHLPNIDKLVDNSSGFKLLSFMDAYSGYNQIKMAEIDKKKTAFMTKTGNYYYNVMPFGLKNAGATYQRMMNKVFHNEIGDMLEVYMDDMIVKSEEEIDHTVHLKRVFDQARKFNMRFNPEKCTFGVKAGKFLGFYLTERGIEANPDKCRAFFDYPTPKSKKSIQTLNGMLTSMARFVAKSAQHALPLFKLLRKETTF